MKIMAPVAARTPLGCGVGAAIPRPIAVHAMTEIMTT
jgi:hypothetical protein